MLSNSIFVTATHASDALPYDFYNREIAKNKRLQGIPQSDNPVESMLQGKGTIDFDTFVAYPTGSWPEVVGIGDLNNDNRNDVVLGTSFYFDSLNDYKVFVYIQDMSGGLNPPVKYDGGYVRAIHVGELNNDNRQDVVIGHSDSIGIFFQNTLGTLDPMISYFSGMTVDGVKIGDLNNDGLKDIAVCHWNEDYIRIFVQEAYGIFDSSVTYAINRGGYDEIDVGDVTGDGRVDVVFMRGQLYANENVAIFEQSLAGLLLPPVFYDLGDTNTHGISIGDVNNDLRKDVVVTLGGNQPSSNISVWLQDASGNMQDPPVSYACYDIPEPIEIADLDLDGLKDVVVANGGWLAISVYQQNGVGTLDPYVNFSIPYASHYQPQGLAVGDINNDNKPDIAIADYNSGLVVLINSSSGGVSIEETESSFQKETHILKLFQNHPNPFHFTTLIQYYIPMTNDKYQMSNILLAVYDLTGRLIETLVNQVQEPGVYQLPISNSQLPGSGIYFYRLETGDFTATKKLILLH